MVVFPLLIVLILSPILWSKGIIYKLATVGQISFYSCALIGALLMKTRIGRIKIFSIPFFFSLVNLASLRATINIIQGNRINRWETQR